MVGPIDIQNVILNATAQSQINSNVLAQAAVGEAFRGIINKKENELKASQVENTEKSSNNPIEENKEHHRKKDTKEGHIDLKA